MNTLTTGKSDATMGTVNKRSSPETQKHPLAIRAMHAISGIAILAMIISGLAMVRMDDANVWKYERLYVWHQSFGIIALVLINLRLVIRLRHHLIALPMSISIVVRRLANAAYFSLYALMLAVPVAGIVMSAAYPEGKGLVFFSLTIPSFMMPSEPTFQLAKTIHWLLAYAMGVLILLHVLGALRHRFFDKPEHNVLTRMF